MDLASVPFVRLLLGLQYFLLLLAGSRMLHEPSLLLQSEMGRYVYAWAWFLVVGGTLCLLTSVTQLWIGEFTGLVLLTVANWAWGYILVSTGDMTTNYGIILIGWGFGLAARWAVVAHRGRGAARSARRDRR